MKNEWKIFGERLKASLNERRVSYRWLADKTGITLTTIWRYANSERVPRASEILKCAKALNVTCDYLIGLSNHPKCTRLNEPERKTGRWIKISPADIYECSACGKNVMTADIDAYDFCHGCGAKMEVEHDVG